MREETMRDVGLLSVGDRITVVFNRREMEAKIIKISGINLLCAVNQFGEEERRWEQFWLEPYQVTKLRENKT